VDGSQGNRKKVAAGGGSGVVDDDLAATINLATEECITLKMPDTEARDRLVSCLSMFSDQARQGGKRAVGS